MRTNTSDLRSQVISLAEEHEQVLKELKNIQSVTGYISRLLDAYGIMSRRVDELENEIQEIRRNNSNVNASTRKIKEAGYRIEKTKFPNMELVWTGNR
ncbi:hypothetical protein H8744_11555 [Oscillospiraceae bacterium N12]|uniref:Uncharacterized protein n=1 Tax=Jilunia laotingensis TaxID=2763675 RepID=A0A926F1D8_9BACT|nr:hypothetical protein [Jilunia laotingensis]MBC8593868.1 hypothetical protein [Jilunia laotingensis]